MYDQRRYRPTFWGTLAQQAAITRALWADYINSTRQAWRLARAARPYRLQTAPTWRNDWCFLAVLGIVFACCVALVALQFRGVL